MWVVLAAKRQFMAPLTGVPVGQCTSSHLPSLVDYFMQPGWVISEYWIDWLPAVADHAFVAAASACSSHQLPPRRGKWHYYNSWSSGLAWMARKAGELLQA